jgi:predicted DNA-binding antitoxin AbrB/MazE fold protein
MGQIITATFEDGLLKPDVPLDLAPRARVRLSIEPLVESPSTAEAVWDELERLWAEVDIDSGAAPPPHDQRHDRR